MYNQFTYLSDLITIKSLCNINKTASEEPSFVSGIAGYVKSLFDKEFQGGVTTDKFIKFLSPALIYQIFQALGFGWFSKLAGLLAAVFGVDLAPIFSRIISEIKSALSSGGKLASSQINSIVESALPQTLKTAKTNYEGIIKYARGYGKEEESVLKGIYESVKNMGDSRMTVGEKIFGLLRSVLSWTFVTVLWAGGFLIAGDVVNSLLSKYTGFSPKDMFSGKSSPSNSGATGTSGTPSSNSPSVEYHSDGWVEDIVNNENNIINLLLDYVEEYYPKSDEAKIVNSRTFKGIVKHIMNANFSTKNYKFVAIPNNFHSRKDIADRIMSGVK